VWNIETKKCICTIVTDSGGVKCVTIINALSIASVGMDATIKIWKLAPNYSSASLVQTMTGHTNLVVSLSTITFPIVAMYAFGWRAFCFDSELRNVPLSSESRKTSPRESGLWVVSASCDGTIRCWDVAKGFCMRTLSDHDGGQVESMKVFSGIYPVLGMLTFFFFFLGSLLRT